MNSINNNNLCACTLHNLIRYDKGLNYGNIMMVELPSLIFISISSTARWGPWCNQAGIKKSQKNIHAAF